MNTIRNIILFQISQLNHRHIQIVLIVISLLLFVLAAGAPEAGGGVGITGFGGGTN